jgi:DNA-binding NarL/FixJ family response regulator
MKHHLETDTATTEPADCGARVVLMTADGGSIDITSAAGDLLYLARRTVHPADEVGVGTFSCPTSLTLLCQHLGRCKGGCNHAPAPPAAPTGASVELDGKLTGRESQVVEQVRQGFTNKEIARRLGIQEDTVKKHLQAVFGKLGVRRRALLALRHV